MEINYHAERTASKFHKSRKKIKGLRGPVGSGKTVSCIMECVMLSARQAPNSDGIRKTRGVIVRNTSPELRSTTLNTWKQWMPEIIAPITMNPMIVSKVSQPLADGTTMQIEVYFLALDVPKDVRKLLSLEVTWIFCNEARELVYAVIAAGKERIGRYPSEIDGYHDVYDKSGKLTYDAPKERDENGELIMFDENGNPDVNGTFMYQPCTESMMVMDTNPPDDDHWWYQLAEEGCLRKSSNKEVAIRETKRIFEFFNAAPPLIKQENGEYTKNPDAENIRHLPGGFQYYLDMIAGSADDHINVMVLGNYGSIQDGKPVYPNYNDALHCQPVTKIKGLPIALGWDFGLTPACIIGQLTDTGQVRILCELVSEDMDVFSFARDVVKPFLAINFKDYHIAFSMADPAGNNRGEGEGKSSIGLLNDMYPLYDDKQNLVESSMLRMGFTTEPAPTNDPTLRIRAVAIHMQRLIGQGEPGYIIDKRCKVLRKGKLGAYCYKKIQVGGTDRFREAPDKNYASHPADAEQYLCLGFNEGYSVVTELEEYLEAEAENYEGDDDSIIGW